MRADRGQTELVEERADLLRRDRPVGALRVPGELHGLVAERGERLEHAPEAAGERLPEERVGRVRVDDGVVEPRYLVADGEQLDAELPRRHQALARAGARRPPSERHGGGGTGARPEERASTE